MTFIEDSYFNYLDWFLISSRFFWWFSFNSIFQTDIFSKVFSFELFKFPSLLAFFLISRKCLFPAINVNESPWKTSSTKADSNEYYPKNFIKSWRYFSSKGLESFFESTHSALYTIHHSLFSLSTTILQLTFSPFGHEVFQALHWTFSLV